MAGASVLDAACLDILFSDVHVSNMPGAVALLCTVYLLCYQLTWSMMNVIICTQTTK